MKRFGTLLMVAIALAVAAGPVDATETISVKPVAEGLIAPNLAVHAGDGSGRLFITEQTGQILIVDADGKLLETPFLDIADRMVPLGAFGPGTFDERGLLGLAFHPDYGNGSNKFYVYYSAPREPDIDVAFDHPDIPKGEREFTWQGVMFSGGEVGTAGEPRLYATPPNAYLIPENGTATLTLPDLAVITRFYFVHRPGDGAGQVEFLNAAGNRIGSAVPSKPATEMGDPQNFLFFENRNQGIKSLRFTAGASQNGQPFTLFVDDLTVSRFNHESHISEFAVSNDDPNVADPDSERILLVIDEPQFNHNSGMIEFGPDDGYLYIAVGDGGNAHDIGPGHTPKIGNAQDLSKLLGKMLRIDVDNGEPYGIPDDNPFVGREGRDEIYAYGLRNCFRWSFDMGGDHRLFGADVGQALYEEVHIIEKGMNLGWNIREGFHCFDPENPGKPPVECPDTGYHGEPLIDPILEYPHAGPENEPHGISIIGGYVHRNPGNAALFGKYVFGDWSRSFGGPPSGSIFVAEEVTPGEWAFGDVKMAGTLDRRPPFRVLGFGQDASGDVYVCATQQSAPIGNTGVVYKIIAPPDCDAVRGFKARCRDNNKVVVKVRTGLEAGTGLHVDNNGETTALTVDDDGDARFKFKRQRGAHTYTLTECPELARTIDCDE